ncbi:MAG: transferase [Desulforudis sp.]|jgi:carbonic anhydrase/acetyltransferase-like protein (isoleucine patch superfamily)|nr:transferase [Clostridia bacterium]RJX19951.1 MAG: transferase [Desulforudis sp.]
MLRASPVTSWNSVERTPLVCPGSYVDETAVLIGQVIVRSGVIVCPLVVLRADEGFPIEIGEGSNIQDGVVMHCLLKSEIQIGRNCSVAHGAIIHGPSTVGDGSFIGFRATLLGTTLEAGCFVGHGAQILDVNIPEERYVPPGRVISTQVEANRLPPVTSAHKEFVNKVLRVNAELLLGYLNQSVGGIILGEELLEA